MITKDIRYIGVDDKDLDLFEGYVLMRQRREEQENK